jgi:pyridoxamine 5'-phosphate oxidase-like protein
VKEFAIAKQFQQIESAQRAFIERQHIFFAASAAPSGRVNLSPKGMDKLRVLNPTTVIYLDLTGSGNETAAHVRTNGRLTLMFCAFEGPPMILRLYGTGRMAPRGSAEYASLLAAHFGNLETPGARQIVVMEVDLVQTSCGFAVPQFDYVSDRQLLVQWAEKQGEAGLEAYRRDKNAWSLDGFSTGLLEANS